jgi:hypothetical protein
MTRLFRPGLATAVVLAAVACSAPEPPKAGATPVPPMPKVVPLAVHVALPENASPETAQWARELEDAIAARAGDLELVADPSAARLIVRIASVESAPEGVKVGGEGEAFVMRGALVVGDATRDFNLTYRGEARAQTQALARNLRRLADETRQQAAATPEPSQ